MVRFAGAIVVCAIVAFAAAFYAAGADHTTIKHVKPHAKPVPFADTAASAVAGSFAGHPVALKLPPPRHVKHHAKPATPTVTPPPTTTNVTPTISPPAYVPPPAPKHKSKGGTGTGTTVVGP
jgi:hypothetical protein